MAFLNWRESCSIIGLWIGDHAQFAHLLTPTALVELRPLTRVSNPPQAISAVGVSHLRLPREQAEEIQTTECVGSFIMATVLQSDHEDRETLSEDRRAGRSLLRVPRSGLCQARYKRISVKRQNGSRCEPHPSVGEVVRELAAGALQHQSIGVSKGQPSKMVRSDRHIRTKLGATCAQARSSQRPVRLRGGWDQGETRRTGLEDCIMGNDTVARLKVLGRTAPSTDLKTSKTILNGSYGSVADSPGDHPRRLTDD